MQKQFSGRALSTALRQTAVVVEELGIQKPELVDISVDPWGDSEIHLEPAGFVRVFRSLRVNKDKREMHTSEAGNLHAMFFAKGCTWRTMIRAGTPEMEAIKAALMESNPQRAISSKALPLLLAGPK